ncbi:polysaccharide deacetylase family protein [Halomicronema hongdechloris]|uniref:hypothetical protein n=1 Tax=Halomicronema hongdechloris TaxID=1209493 RepID=UPI0010CC331E|nr:hypothetical protein [Halomicronema hongdechloris]
MLRSLSRYWPKNKHIIADLPILSVSNPVISEALSLREIPLPDWASIWGVGGILLVPAETCPCGIHWEQVDWWLASFLLLECWHERSWEDANGPIHSYSFRLRAWDKRVWERAWVNRVALFLREWVAQIRGEDVEHLFGALPSPEFIMTHDIDAVSKTWAIRLKQGVFNGVNALRALGRKDLTAAIAKTQQAIRFLLSQEDWWVLDDLLQMEQQRGIRSIFHFYADPAPKTLKRWLMDPAYSITAPKVQSFIEKLQVAKYSVGIHPSFDAWHDKDRITAQRKHLQLTTGINITDCRQHWLRFSWDTTWSAQTKAGLQRDTTLMFNDRSGFRNASAIAWRPWHRSASTPHQIIALPSMLMDSHLYDYALMTDNERVATIQYWVEECRMVRGQVALLWHPHTLTQDYGWAKGLQSLFSVL